MPGRSKKGGGLESSPVYKKQEFGTPFKMNGFSGFGNSPLKQDYVRDRYHPKFNPTGTKGKNVKKTAKKTAKKTGTKVAKQIFKRFLGPVGVAYTAYDAYNIAKHSIKEKSLKKGLKKWWNE
mgnify:FL=1